MKGRKHRGTGGLNEAEEDLKSKPEPRTNAKEIDKEAEEKKHGGRAKRKHGGKVHGEMAKHHAGRKPRASGGAACEKSPFTSANHGKDPKGHKTGGGAPELEGENEKA